MGEAERRKSARDERAQQLKDSKQLIDDVAKQYPDYKTMAGLRFTAPALVDHFKNAKVEKSP